MNEIETLKREIKTKGIKQVASELGVSVSSINLLVTEKYPGNLENMLRRIKKIYGNGGINCPVLGKITPTKCGEKWNLAKKIGMKAGNPETLRLYRMCLNCSLRAV